MDAIVKSSTGIAALFAGAVLMSAPSFARDLSLDDVRLKGTGCNGEGELVEAQDLNGDGEDDAFTITFDEDFIASQGAGVEANQRRKFCDIRMDLDLPRGFQIGIFQATYLGSADLAPSVYGTQRSIYRFPFFGPQRATASTTLAGPYGAYTPDAKDGFYQRTDRIPVSSIVWSPCGRDGPDPEAEISILAQVALAGRRNIASDMDLLTVDGEVCLVDDETCEFEEILHFRFRSCDD